MEQILMENTEVGQGLITESFVSDHEEVINDGEHEHTHELFDTDQEVEILEVDYLENKKRRILEHNDRDILEENELFEEDEGMEQKILIEHEVLTEEILEARGQEIIEDEQVDDTQEENSNQEVVIFKTEDEDSVFTYSIPVSNTQEYETGTKEQFQTIIIKEENHLSQHQSYEIIEGYLVATNPGSKSNSTIPSPGTHVRNMNLRPTNPWVLTPDLLRKKARLNPNKLLIIYHCSFCDSAFEDFHSIKIHESEHITVGDNVLTNSNPQTNYLGTKLIPQTESRFNCPYCFKGFPVGAALRLHIRKNHEKKSRRRKLGSEKKPTIKTPALAQQPQPIKVSPSDVYTNYTIYTNDISSDHATTIMVSNETVEIDESILGMEADPVIIQEN